MADITPYLPKSSETAEKIYKHYKKAGDRVSSRKYLGASIIGHHCERYLWYDFRQATKPEIEGRIYRLWETGDLEEIRLVTDLRSIGCDIHDIDQDGNQFAISDLSGHFSGHLDGAGLGIPEAPKTWHVLEFKTHNNKSFVKLVKDEVQKSKPQHYAQMQIYMHKTGMKRALYMAVNKDTDELYTERIHHDQAFCEGLMERAKRVIFDNQPPERPYNRSDYYLCSWCDAQEICWGTGNVALPIVTSSCRQCCHATPKLDGHARWFCSKHGRSLSSFEQDDACDKHLLLPSMLPFAEPIGHGQNLAGDDYIVFTSYADTWYHGAHDRGFSTAELMTLRKQDLTNEMILGAKEAMGAVATDACDDILNRYPEEDTRIVWEGHQTELADEWSERYREDFWSLEPLEISKLPDDRNVAEFKGGRLAVVLLNGHGAQIREGVK